MSSTDVLGSIQTLCRQLIASPRSACRSSRQSRFCRPPSFGDTSTVPVHLQMPSDAVIRRDALRQLAEEDGRVAAPPCAGCLQLGNNLRLAAHRHAVDGEHLAAEGQPSRLKHFVCEPTDHWGRGGKQGKAHLSCSARRVASHDTLGRNAHAEPTLSFRDADRHRTRSLWLRLWLFCSGAAVSSPRLRRASLSKSPPAHQLCKAAMMHILL